MEGVTNSDSILENRLIHLMEQYEKDLLRMCSVYPRDTRQLSACLTISAKDGSVLLSQYNEYDIFKNSVVLNITESK